MCSSDNDEALGKFSHFSVFKSSPSDFLLLLSLEINKFVKISFISFGDILLSQQVFKFA